MPRPDPATPIAWWEDRRYALALILASAIPLIWPALPPLTDALGHLARYHVELNLDRSPYLARYFDFRWALIGNLGVDLLMVPLAPIFGLTLALKLVVMAIPVLLATGLLAVAREVHGRLPPTAAFALPMAYGFPFQFGFLNHCLAMALALNAFALWLWLGRRGQDRLRAVLFVPIGGLIWLCHVYGWGFLGLLAFSAELTRDRGEGGTRWHALWRAGVAMLPLTPPILLMLLWRSGDVAGFTGDWFNLQAKTAWILGSLRDRWQWLDMGAVLLIAVLIYTGFGRGLRFVKPLGLAALIIALAYLLLPRILLGSAYADMRLVPYLFAVALIALSAPTQRRVAGWLALGALAFFTVRTAATTISFLRYDRAYAEQLRALDRVAPGSRIMALVAVDCHTRWATARMDHLGSQGIVRRDAFVNGQWAMPGAQLLSVTYKAAGRFAEDPSQLLRPARCRGRNEANWSDTMANFPRGAFDYLWLINLGAEQWPNDPGLQRIWSFPRGALFRVDPSKPKADYSAISASDTPNGRLLRASQ